MFFFKWVRTVGSPSSSSGLSGRPRSAGENLENGFTGEEGAWASTEIIDGAASRALATFPWIVVALPLDLGSLRCFPSDSLSSSIGAEASKPSVKADLDGAKLLSRSLGGTLRFRGSANSLVFLNALGGMFPDLTVRFTPTLCCETRSGVTRSGVTGFPLEYLAVRLALRLVGGICECFPG